MTAHGDLVAELESVGVKVCWAQELVVPGLWAKNYSLLVLSAAHDPEDQEQACREVLLIRSGGTADLRPTRSRCPRHFDLARRLSPEERTSEVCAAVEQVMAMVSTAGEDGVLLSDLRRDLCLFASGVVAEALRVARNDASVNESRERRADFGGAVREQVVLRSRPR
ncbi:MAG: hypothetical protein M3O94_04740 [Actinomycetota bacterium]|nr:hypothetical protein [Actinomycetota bacterium]